MSDESLKPTPQDLEITERQQFWLDHVKACEASGDTATQYAKIHDLPVTSLYQRKKEFRKRGLLPTPSCKVPSFAKVRRTSDGVREGVLRICFPSGVRVEWLASSKGSEIKQLLQVVAHLS